MEMELALCTLWHREWRKISAPQVAQCTLGRRRLAPFAMSTCVIAGLASYRIFAPGHDGHFGEQGMEMAAAMVEAIAEAMAETMAYAMAKQAKEDEGEVVEEKGK